MLKIIENLPPYIKERLAKIQEENKDQLLDGQISNHIHFWTEKEDEKTVLCFQPTLALPIHLWEVIDKAFRVPNHQE